MYLEILADLPAVGPWANRGEADPEGCLSIRFPAQVRSHRCTYDTKPHRIVRAAQNDSPLISLLTRKHRSSAASFDAAATTNRVTRSGELDKECSPDHFECFLHCYFQRQIVVSFNGNI